MSKTIIGVDVGGTSIKIGWLSIQGDILHKWEIPTDTSDNGKTILTDIWESISNSITSFNMDRDNVIGIGVGVPGFIITEEGIVDEAVNIGWKNINVKKELSTLSGLPVCVANDANTAVLGENWRGAGNQAKNVLAVTIGSGVGGGVIVNGVLVSGENGAAGEIGRSTVDLNGCLCNCGKKGCLATIASATGIVRQAQESIKVNSSSGLAQLYSENGHLTAKDVFDLADKGDEISGGIIQHTMDVLGLSLANVATVLNPSKILIGGGVSNAGPALINGIRTSFQKYALPRTNKACTIKTAQLGNDAGMIGAAFLVKQQLHHVKF